MALSLLFSASEAPASLPTVLFVALRPSFSIRQAQSVQIFLHHSYTTKPAPFWKLYLVVEAPKGLPLSFPSLSFRPLPYAYLLHFLLRRLLSHTLGRVWLRHLSISFSIRMQCAPGHSFLRGNDVSNELTKQGNLSIH